MKTITSSTSETYDELLIFYATNYYNQFKRDAVFNYKSLCNIYYPGQLTND